MEGGKGERKGRIDIYNGCMFYSKIENCFSKL